MQPPVPLTPPSLKMATALIINIKICLLDFCCLTHPFKHTPSTCCHEEGNAQFSCKLSGRVVVQGTFVFSLLDSPYSPIHGRQQIMLHLKSEHHISQIICFATVSLFIPDEEDFIPCCYNHTAEQTHRLIFEQYNIATGLLNISYLSKLFSFFAHSISLPINI